MNVNEITEKHIENSIKIKNNNTLSIKDKKEELDRLFDDYCSKLRLYRSKKKELLRKEKEKKQKNLKEIKNKRTNIIKKVKK